LSHSSSPFCSGYFGDGILYTMCPGYPWTTVLPISASQIASTSCPALTSF
jgi:hypothetical protein